MDVNYKQDECALKHITYHYNSPVNLEKHIKLIIYDKKFQTTNK